MLHPLFTEAPAEEDEPAVSPAVEIDEPLFDVLDQTPDLLKLSDAACILVERSLQALLRLVRQRVLPRLPLTGAVAATSAGVVRGVVMLDLCYEEDSQAEVDLNVVMTGDGHFIELQGTGESGPLTGDELTKLIDMGRGACRELGAHQKKALGG